MWACYRRSLEMGNHDSNVGPGRTPSRFPPTPESLEDETGDSDDDEEQGEASPRIASEKDDSQYRERVT
jgi:hypothetical protein